MSHEFIIKNISKDCNENRVKVENTVLLMQEGATIPFIARYRKERTGELDETAIRFIFERYEYYSELVKRKETVIATIDSQDKLTDDLRVKIENCTDRAELEDIYLPFKPKKRTRATIAKEKGLEPLADIMFFGKEFTGSKRDIIEKFINNGKGVESFEDAVNGAKDIIAERISENTFIRGWIRKNSMQTGKISAKVKKEWKDKRSKFEDYYDFSESVANSPSHRILAIRRAMKENVIGSNIEIDTEFAVNKINSAVIKKHNSAFKEELEEAVADGFKRLLFPSVEKEVFSAKIEEAEREAIQVFSKNLRNLLLSSPAGNKVIIGIDPGYRTGCKVAVVGSNGDFLEHTVIYPVPPKNEFIQSEKILLSLVKKYDASLISIGNGTASKETEKFVKDTIRKNSLSVNAVVVNEAGASVYSASETAAKEFPDLDVTVRGAISIARRLQDPLAELVKIDPKSIGVGQYQHDVDQKELKQSLGLTVESCVNYVGVDANTASAELLSYVSGINRAIAENIVAYRSEHNSLKNRNELKKISKLGPKAFEQCAGFIRIKNGKNCLDNSAIHPESYDIVNKMAQDLKIDVAHIIGNENVIKNIKIENYVTEKCGIPTLRDILEELKKPGLDPREEFETVEFNKDINDISDLAEGMILNGIVTNVTNFGAFTDIGVHQDGLIHISKLSSGFVKNVYDVVAVGDQVKVKVVSVDAELKRISLERIEN